MSRPPPTTITDGSCRAQPVVLRATNIGVGAGHDWLADSVSDIRSNTKRSRRQPAAVRSSRSVANTRSCSARVIKSGVRRSRAINAASATFRLLKLEFEPALECHTLPTQSAHRRRRAHNARDHSIPYTTASGAPATASRAMASRLNVIFPWRWYATSSTTRTLRARCPPPRPR